MPGGEVDNISEKIELHRYQKRLFKEDIENSMMDFTKNTSKTIFESLEQVKEYKDLYVSLDYKELEEKMVIAALVGYVESIQRNKWMEFAEDIDPFSLPFEDAIKYLIEKEPVLFEKIDELTLEIKNNFKWIKKSTDLEITKKMFQSLDENIKTGGTFLEWKESIQEIANKAGFGDRGYYLENIYRTNTINAYNIGTYKEQMETKEDFPYLLYDAISDEYTTEICKRLDGKIYRSDDPIWNEIYPGNHYQCRSGVISISKEELEDGGYVLSEYDPNIISDLEKTDFKGNPGTIWKKIEKGVKLKEKTVEKLDEELSKNLEPFMVEFDIKKFKPKLERELASKILDNFGLDVPVKHKSMANSYGYVSSLRQNGKFVEMAFKTGDKRSIESKIKTMFHETFHASSLNQKNMPYHHLEELMAESVGTYLSKVHGANSKKIANSYLDYLIDGLPKLKKLKEFSNCNQVEDFGEVLLKLGREETDRLLKTKNLKISSIKTGRALHKAIQPYKEIIKKDEIKDVFIDLLKGAGPFDIENINDRNCIERMLDDLLVNVNSKDYTRINSNDEFLYQKLFDSIWKVKGVR